MLNWQEYVRSKLKSLHEQQIQEDDSVVQVVAESLAMIFDLPQQLQIEAYLQSQWAILVRVTHFADFLKKVQLPEEELQILLHQQALIDTIYRLATELYTERFKQQLQISNSVQRSPGFLRFLREECGLQFVMHYVGFSLRSFMAESWKDEPQRLQDERFFQESFEYLLEVVLDFENIEELNETLRKQADEILWLSEELALKQAELALEPANERFQMELDILNEDYFVEKLERDYLDAVIEPIF
jgi:hypothetical protein